MKLPSTVRLLLLVLALSLACRVAVAAPSDVKWIKGFPQRIGAQVMLMWEPVPGAAKYVVSRNSATGGATSWETTTNNAIDAKVDLAETYVYAVSARDAANRVIGATPEVTLVGTKPLDPPKWGGSHQDGPKLLLSWSGDHRTVFYNLYRNLQGEPPKVIAAVSSTNYVDEAIAPDTAYEYFLRSVDASGVESKDSGRITIRVAKWEEKKTEAVEHRLVEVQRLKLAPEVKIGEPTDLLIRNNVVYITDLGSRSVMGLSQDGKLVRRFAVKPPEYQGVWGIPWGISADSFGRRYAVTFLQSPNVRVFDEYGTMILDIPVTPPPELKPNQYLPSPPQPMDVAVEEQEGYWVSDYTYGQVLYFDVRGKEAGRVGKSRVEKDFGPFRSPTFLVVHPGSGYVNLVDSMQAKVFRIFNDGKVAGSWSSTQEGEGQLHLPKGIDVNEKGELMVVDGLLSTLQSFTQAGKLTAVYESIDEREMPMPTGMVTVAVNRDSGDIFVISKVENAITRLRYVRSTKGQ